jgi:hypothetical protein
MAPNPSHDRVAAKQISKEKIRANIFFEYVNTHLCGKRSLKDILLKILREHSTDLG